jgi:hypothetical protein
MDPFLSFTSNSNSKIKNVFIAKMREVFYINVTTSPLVVELRQKEKHRFVDLFLTNLINISSNLICRTVVGKIGISKVVDAPGQKFGSWDNTSVVCQVTSGWKTAFCRFFLGESCKGNRSFLSVVIIGKMKKYSSCKNVKTRVKRAF